MAINTGADEGLLVLSNEILTQIVDILDPAEDALSLVSLALTSSRLYNIVLSSTKSPNLKTLVPKPKSWFFTASDYLHVVQDRFFKKEATKKNWTRAVKYLRLIERLQDGSMRMMEDKGYKFGEDRGLWVRG